MIAGATLLIRADASTQIGTGHVMRCLALAQAWQEVGGSAFFVFAHHVPNLEMRLHAEGVEIEHLAGICPGSEEDASATAVLGQKLGAQWVVVDGYHFDAQYQWRLRAAGFRLLFIDDFGHATHYFADIVLNQNIGASVDAYKQREPYTQLLLGTPYALMRREFWDWVAWQREFAEKGRKVLVTLGGSDPNNVTIPVIKALQQLPHDDLEVIVLAGGQNLYFHEIEVAVALDSRLQIRRNATSMPELMAWADLAVAGGGSTCWELCLMQLPMLTITLAANQQPVVQGLVEANAAVSLGWYESLTEENIIYELSRLIDSKEQRAALGLQARLQVDGCGARRVAEGLSGKWLTLRSVKQEDARLIWSWTNDPAVRRVSFSSQQVSWDSHLKWFQEKLVDPDCFFYIAFDHNELPVGQVRYEVHDREFVISISLASEYRGQGYGALLIRQATQKFFIESGAETVKAFIKEQNVASIRAFAKAGFQESDPILINGYRARQFCLMRDQGVVLPCSK